MYVIVTGGCGYIGSHIVLELLLQDYNVIVIDNLSNSSKSVLDKISSFTKKNILFYQLDIVNKQDLEPIFQDFSNEISGVIHAAGVKSVSESIQDPIKYYKNNVVGSINVLELMDRYKINNFVFSSSATVYGVPKDIPIKENHSISPINPYGSSKAAIENLLFDLTSIKSVVLRYFNPVGNHPSCVIGEEPLGVPNNLFPYITRVLTKQPGYEFVSVFGDTYPTLDGTGVRDYIHVCDLVSAHIKAFEYLLNDNNENDTKDSNIDRVFNIGTETGYSVLQVLKKMEFHFKTSVPFTITEKRNGDVGTVIADSSRAKRVLGWTAEKDLDDTCRDLCKFNSL
jgi:UDP-glucose 4-epimerase